MKLTALPSSVTAVTVMPLPPVGVAGGAPRPPPVGSAQGSCRWSEVSAGRGCALNRHKSNSTLAAPAPTNWTSTISLIASSSFASPAMMSNV